MTHSDSKSPDYRERLILDANREIKNLRKMKKLMTQHPDCITHLSVMGTIHSFSTSIMFLDLVNNEIKEIQKAIKGLPNKWE
jgi:hypothetical protein